jgi:hypothetical protein
MRLSVEPRTAVRHGCSTQPKSMPAMIDKGEALKAHPAHWAAFAALIFFRIAKSPFTY